MSSACEVIDNKADFELWNTNTNFLSTVLNFCKITIYIMCFLVLTCNDAIDRTTNSDGDHSVCESKAVFRLVG